MKIYLAGPLFTEAERAFNLELAHLLEKEGHEVYLPQRDTPAASGPRRTATLFRANLTGLNHADCVVAICDGPQVDDGTAWEIGYAWGRNIRVLGLRTDSRVAQQQDERINLMILESLDGLSSSVSQLIHRIRHAKSSESCRRDGSLEQTDPSRRGGAAPMTENELIGEIAECLQEALRLQSRVTEVTERVHQAAGMSVADRALRAKVTGLFFGLLAHLEELNRLVREAM